MRKQHTTLLGIVIAFMMSCQNKNSSTSAETTVSSATLDSAKAVVQKVFDFSNKLDFEKVFEYYSGDADAKYVENGYIYSLDSLKAIYRQTVPTIDLIENTVKSWDLITISNDAVTGTLPVHVKIKAKGRDPYEFDYVWSCVVQKRHGKWQLIQSHESWQNYEKAMEAVSPLPATK